jgi:hypothetical protein
MEVKTKVCDICKSKISTIKCFLCGKDICDDHNFGGKYANVYVDVIVYNDIVFDVNSKIPLIDCCPDCTETLKDIKKSDDGRIMQKMVDKEAEDIKNWVLNMLRLSKKVK